MKIHPRLGGSLFALFFILLGVLFLHIFKEDKIYFIFSGIGIFSCMIAYNYFYEIYYEEDIKKAEEKKKLKKQQKEKSREANNNE